MGPYGSTRWCCSTPWPPWTIFYALVGQDNGLGAPDGRGLTECTGAHSSTVAWQAPEHSASKVPHAHHVCNPGTSWKQVKPKQFSDRMLIITSREATYPFHRSRLATGEKQMFVEVPKTCSALLVGFSLNDLHRPWLKGSWSRNPRASLIECSPF